MWQDKIEKILIIMMGGIGNMILLAPTLRALRDRFPDVSISLLVGCCRAEKIIQPSQ